MFTKLALSSSSNTYATLTAAPAAEVDNEIPKPSSSWNADLTSESNPELSSVAPLTTPATEPGLSATDMSPTTIVAPPVENVMDSPPPAAPVPAPSTSTVIDRPVEIEIPLAVVVDKPKSTELPIEMLPSPVVSLI